MATVTITCANCGKSHDIDRSEYNYQVRKGRKRFFCSIKCSAIYNNSRLKKDRFRRLVCPVCGKEFTTEAPYKVTFCSRSCASKGSITEYRRKRMSEGGKIGQKQSPGTTHSISCLMKQREHYRYEECEKYLNNHGIEHEFEYVIGDYVFDLAIFQNNTLFEFDEEYHSDKQQIIIDNAKDEVAKRYGWNIVRIPISTHSHVDPSWIVKYI